MRCGNGENKIYFVDLIKDRVAYPDPKDQNHFGGSGSEIFPPIRDRRKERLKFEFKFLRESNIAVVKNLYPDPERETRLLIEIKSLIRIRIKTSSIQVPLVARKVSGWIG